MRVSSKTRTRLVLSISMISYVSATLFATSLCTNPAAAQTAAGENPSIAKVESGSTTETVRELTLGDLRDAGLALERIRQQAINVYVEARRKPVSPKMAPQLADPRVIPMKEIGTHLPPRREWLVFYMGTMEPIIHLLGKDVDDIRNGVHKLVVPERIKSDFNPQWEEWTSTVEDMNNHLSSLLDLIEEAGTKGDAIAKEAVAIYEDTKKLEHVRRQVYTSIQEVEQKNSRQTVSRH